MAFHPGFSRMGAATTGIVLDRGLVVKRNPVDDLRIGIGIVAGVCEPDRG